MNKSDIEKFIVDFLDVQETSYTLEERASIAIKFYMDLANKVGLKKQKTWKYSTISKIDEVNTDSIVFEWEEQRSRGGYDSGLYRMNILALAEETYQDYITIMVNSEKEHEDSFNDFAYIETKRV